MRKSSVYLTFHGIGTAPSTVPADEVPYWIDKARFEEMIAQMAEEAARKGVNLVATFDDGNHSDIGIAAPLLEAHNIAGIFFPCAARIGQTGYLDGSDLRALQSAGFAVGSHGMDHLPWARLRGAALLRETVEAKTVIETALRSPVTEAALPFGSYNRRALTALRTAGFEKVFSSDPGLSHSDAWFTRRFSYRTGRAFDLGTMIATHSTLSKRLMQGLKHRIKALR